MIDPALDTDSSGFESDVQNPDNARLIAEAISKIIPPEFDFKFRVCELEVACGLKNLPQKDVFSEEVSVSATLGETGCLGRPGCEFFPKKIRLFVWDKD